MLSIGKSTSRTQRMASVRFRGAGFLENPGQGEPFSCSGIRSLFHVDTSSLVNRRVVSLTHCQEAYFTFLLCYMGVIMGL